MKLIGFAGKMGSGKTTAIECLMDVTPNRAVVNVKFAQPLYDMQEYIYRRISPVHEKPEGFIKDRKLLQWIGTDWGRDSISKTLWVDLWKASALAQSRRLDFIIVCDDVRFDNEAEAIHELGGKVIRLEREERKPDGGAGIVGHSSEAGLSEHLHDVTILNNTTVQDFRAELKRVYKIFANNWQDNG